MDNLSHMNVNETKIIIIIIKDKYAMNSFTLKRTFFSFNDWFNLCFLIYFLKRGVGITAGKCDIECNFLSLFHNLRDMNSLLRRVTQILGNNQSEPRSLVDQKENKSQCRSRFKKKKGRLS